MRESVRQPAVAGRFYPGAPAALSSAVEAYLALGAEPKRAARAVVVPHAGYVYSGAIAGQTFGSIRAPEHAVVLCPNHTGLGPEASLYQGRAWELPGGALAVDDELAGAICDKAGLTRDVEAHRGEHAIEVQLPFLRALNPRVSIVPICLSQLSLPACEKLGSALASAIAASGRALQTLLVASTDMSHYVDARAARELDGLALERVQALDPAGLYDVVRRRKISMCGFIPTTVVLFAAKLLGGVEARLVRYGNSGETSGDFSRVVGYAGVVIAGAGGPTNDNEG